VLTLLTVLKPFHTSVTVTRLSDKPIKFDWLYYICLALLHVHAWTFNYHRMVPSVKERKWFSIYFIRAFLQVTKPRRSNSNLVFLS